MPESSTKAEVEARLRGATAAIRDHIDAIEEEVATTGTALRQYLRKNPLVSVGGALAAGLLVGWLLGGRGRRLSRAHRRLVEHYVDAMRDEVRAAVADGAEVGEAVQEAFRNRTPLIVYGEADDGGGFLRQAFNLTLSAAVPLVVRGLLEGMIEPPTEAAPHVRHEPPVEESVPSGGESSAS